MNFLLLIINPGSTSTKLAIYQDDKLQYEKNCSHVAAEIGRYGHILEQVEFRKQKIYEFLTEAKIPVEQISAVIGRGGLLKPICGGTYIVNEKMCFDLRNAPKEHASNLGGLLAEEIGTSLGIPAFIVDPVVVDEMESLARISGLKGIRRVSIFHALNQKASARKAAALLGKGYDECNLIVAHMGGGVSVGAHQKGNVVDVNNALDGDGPFSPERAGGLPAVSLIDLCFQAGMAKEDVYRSIVGRGGLVSYLGVNDAREVEKMITQGDKDAKMIYQAMSYQVAKEIGAGAAVLKGRVDTIVLTGGLAYSQITTGWIKEMVEFIAPVLILPVKTKWKRWHLARSGY